MTTNQIDINLQTIENLEADRVQLNGATTNYADDTPLQDVLEDMDDRIDAGVGGGGGGMPLNYFGAGYDGSTVINSGAFTYAPGVGSDLVINNNVLVRDAYFVDLELNGGDLDTNGFRLHVQGTLTLTSGVIKNNGNNGGNGGNGTGAAGGAAGSQALSASGGNLGAASNPAVAAQAGGFNANGANGSAGTGSTMGRPASNACANGGASGQGQTGGTGATNPTVTFTTLERISHFWTIHTGRFPAGAVSWIALIGNCGGAGSGAGSASSGGGGAGGAGTAGGPVVISAYEIVGTTDIRALGGNGGNGGNGGGTNAGGGGGGNGGNGGTILLTTHDMTGWSGSMDASGGSGGTGGSGVGTGSSGGNGNSGVAGLTISQVV